MMDFQPKRSCLLMICAFGFLGLHGCSRRVAIETSAPAEVITQAPTAEAECTKAEKNVQVPLITVGPEVAFEPWYGLGPFYNITFETVIGPENGPDLTSEYEQNTPFKYRWKLHPEWKDGKALDLRLPPKSSMYFYRVANASETGPVEFTVGTGDGLQVWVNGKEVFKRFEVGNTSTEEVNTNFNKGKNTILLKVYNQSSPSELYFEK